MGLVRIIAACLVLAGCSPGVAAFDAGPADPGTPDAGLPDAGLVDAGPSDAGAQDAGPTEPHWGWAQYTIATGNHSATIYLNGASAGPLAGLSFASSRRYDFIFTPTAIYE